MVSYSSTSDGKRNKKSGSRSFRELLEVTTRFELVDEVLQTLALPLGHVTIFGVNISTPFGAADEARTRYLHLGKVALYQMSYGRILVHLPLHHRKRRPGSGSNRRPPA